MLVVFHIQKNELIIEIFLVKTSENSGRGSGNWASMDFDTGHYYWKKLRWGFCGEEEFVGFVYREYRMKEG